MTLGQLLIEYKDYCLSRGKYKYYGFNHDRKDKTLYIYSTICRFVLYILVTFRIIWNESKVVTIILFFYTLFLVIINVLNFMIKYINLVEHSKDETKSKTDM